MNMGEEEPKREKNGQKSNGKVRKKMREEIGKRWLMWRNEGWDYKK